MSQNNTNLVSIFFAVLFISACSSQPSSSNYAKEPVLITSVSSEPAQALVLDDSAVAIKRIRINHHKVECEGYWVDQCLQYQKEGDTDWSYLYEEIEGFNYEWGHAYELLVEVEKMPAIEGVADQSAIVYRLSQILSDTHHADESFVYSSRHPSTLITKQADGTFELLDGKPISCGIVDCQSIESAMAQQQGIILSLKHDANPGHPLVLEAVLCSSSFESFADDCSSNRY